jgi:hypothetical protein
MPQQRNHNALVAIAVLAVACVAFAADGPKWRRARGRLRVLTSRTEVARLVSPLPAQGDELGRSVAIDGDLIVVGAPQDDDGFSESSGSAYVFTRVGGEWAELQKLVPCDASPWQQFGWSVAVTGANLLVGSPWYSSGSVWRNGCIYLFRPVGGSCEPSCLLTANAAAPSDLLGEIAIFGHTAVLGARLADVDGRTDAGAAHVFLLP